MTPREWMPREQWDALVRGQDCPLCAAVASEEAVDEHGYTVADLAISRVRLAANQYVRGYCVVICKKHVREPYELDEGDLESFFTDVMRVGRTLDDVFKPAKMNFEILGNAVPHLHCHVLPRFYGDPAPGRPIDPQGEVVRLAPAEYEERVRAIAAAL